MSKITQKQKTPNTDGFSKEEFKVLEKYNAGKLRFKKFKNAKDAIDDLHS